MIDPFRRAEQLFRLGRYKEARRAIVEALALDPDRSEAHRLLALTHLRLGDEEAADATAREGIRLAPEDAYAHYVHALVLLERGRTDEAPLRLAEAIRLAPGDADLHALKAEIHAAWQEWPAAEEAAGRALAIDPAHASALGTRAAERLARRRPAEAEELLRAALRRHPDAPHLHRQLGEAMSDQGRAKEAADAYATAARLDPHDDDAAAGFRRAARVGAPRSGPVHAALTRLEEWWTDRGTALLLIAPFVVFALHHVATSEETRAPLLPLPVAEWGFFAFVLVSVGAGPASTLLWRRSPDGRRAVPSGAVRRAATRLWAVAAAAGAGLLLVGAGPARTLPGLVWILAADGLDAAATHPPGPARRRLTRVAAFFVLLPIVAIVAGLALPPLPVGVTIAGYLVAWAALAVTRRRS